MKVEIKILLVWFLLLMLLRLLLLFPHRELGWISQLNIGIQVLLSLISLWIAKKTTNSHRYVYLNFGLLFGFIFPLFVSSFTGESLFPKSSKSILYSFVYVDKFGMSFISLFAVVYALCDDVFRHWKTTKKYITALACALTITMGIFYPYLVNPYRLFSEPEFDQLQQLKTVQHALTKQLNREPNEHELSRAFWSASKNSGDDVDQSSVIVSSLLPYLLPDGDASIFWRPLNTLLSYVNGIILSSIALFLWFVYTNDRPHGDYIDKILILCFLLCFMDILNNYGLSHSLSKDGILTIFTIGQYVTVLVLFAMVYVFRLKLRFVHSAAGQYYEKLIFESPERVTRWRDELDNLILKLFFKKDSSIHRIGHLGNQNLYEQ